MLYSNGSYLSMKGKQNNDNNEGKKGIKIKLKAQDKYFFFFFFFVIMTYHLRDAKTALQSRTITVTLVRTTRMEGVSFVVQKGFKMVNI